MIFQGESLRCDWAAPGIAEMCFDAAGSVNKFDRATLGEFRAIVDALKASTKLRGVMVTSSKSTFIVGADIAEFLRLFAAEESQLRDWLVEANAIFNDFEDLPVPTLAAVNGTAFGGGLEMCLACDLRVAADNAVLSLPETKLGLIPGFGGTTRLPRIIGADNALEWIAGATINKAPAAQKTGVVDAVVALEKLRDVAIATVQKAAAGEIDWKHRRGIKKSPLLLNKLDAVMAFTTAKGFIFSKAGKHYPAPMVAADVVEKAAGLARDEALKVEAEGFIGVARGPVAQSLISLFLNDQVLKKQAKAAAKAARPLQRAAVLGAGIMGGGIAYQAASHGLPVIMKDIRPEALELGLNEASTLLGKQLKRGKINSTKLAQTLNRIVPTLNYADVATADIVIEAVVENPKIKDAVLCETEAQLTPDAVLCSNTSTISITQLALNLKRPEQFCGMHFFNPVHRMPLVEVIRGEKSSDETIASVVSLASAMGKSPIVVNDCPGFLVNRVLFPYFKGFTLLLKEGADFRLIDRIMEGFGWPMGPAYLLDVVGIDTGHHAVDVMAQGFPDRMGKEGQSAIDVLFDAGRYGQKNGSGFYRYELDRRGRLKKCVDEKAFELLAPVSAKLREFDREEVVARMMLPMMIETIRCVEEGIVGSVAEADMGVIYGIGFPPFRGGVLKYADSMGLNRVVELADKYRHLGALYEPTDGMRAMAEAGRTFYPKH